MINQLFVKEVLNMLWCSKNQDNTCYAVQEAWRLVDELANMGAEQTATGMAVSEYACDLEDQIRIIAEENDCKLAPRPYS